MVMLDIIMTHWREDWTIGEPFFRMLDMQLGVRDGDVRVILVQDGEEGRKDSLELMHTRPWYPWIDVVANSDGYGVSAARNTGLKLATAPWVMFCDFDDQFSSVYALRAILETIGRAKEDDYVLWSEFWEELCLPDGRYERRLVQYNQIFNHGKIYRRSFLLERDIWFDEEVSYSEDSLFNSTIDLFLNGQHMIKIPEVFYVWRWNAGSVTNSPERTEKHREDLWKRNVKMTALYYKYGVRRSAAASAVRLICYSFYEDNSEKPLPGDRNVWRRRYWEFYREWKGSFRLLERDELIKVMDAALYDARKKRYLTVEKISLPQWLDGLEKEFGEMKVYDPAFGAEPDG